jgi:arylamine N-acetyltransferase
MKVKIKDLLSKDSLEMLLMSESEIEKKNESLKQYLSQFFCKGKKTKKGIEQLISYGKTYVQLSAFVDSLRLLMQQNPRAYSLFDRDFMKYKENAQISISMLKQIAPDYVNTIYHPVFHYAGDSSQKTQKSR